MDWYYVDAGKQAGPVSEAEFDQLAQTGRIQPATLVWREGMANWLPYSQVRQIAAGAPPISPTVPLTSMGTPVAAGPATAAGSTDVVCAQCNGIFPRENTIQYGSTYVCATCKPIFVQKLKEGAVTTMGLGAMNYAGFWIRFAAKLIDTLIFGVVFGIPGVIFMVASMNNMQGGQPSPAAMGVFYLLIGIAMVASAGYTTFFHGKWGATAGKMACGLKVVMPDGSPISYARSFGRAMAEILSGQICYIGYIIAGFDGEKRSLHDHIANTRVIHIR